MELWLLENGEKLLKKHLFSPSNYCIFARMKQDKLIFDLYDSNNTVGSYFYVSQIKDILSQYNIGIPWEWTHEKIIDEKSVQKHWYVNFKGKKTSFDEVILTKLLKLTYPNIKITSQVRVGRYLMDMLVELDGIKKYIEFDGPNHFTISKYGIPKHPFIKKKIIEEQTGMEVVIWPYWIQRCETNVRRLFEQGQGVGALYDTKVHFGDFYFNDSADIIFALTERFNAFDSFPNFGVGYFYERLNYKHPIVENIKFGKEWKHRLLPKGYKNENFYLPLDLRTI